ncbi:GntR family transcriptional regulator [Pusillimonas sp. T2]|nr:GntR family transcriptional regulator [Pusillimonas sp. T2]ROT46720.1 GntR family transcriptional regulator [Pusillimonas sp. NJUB218]
MTEGVNSTLREQSRLPLSLKVKYTLRGRLERGEWPVGTCIPRLEDLATEYGVSRATVRAALDELEREGLIERIRGKGTFVIGDAAKGHWLMLPTDWDTWINHIETLNAVFTSLGSGVASLPAGLVPNETTTGNYWWTTRVNWSDGRPYSISTVHVCERFWQQQRDDFESSPVLLVLKRQFSNELDHAEQMLTVRIADAVMARQLQIEIGMPVARVVRLIRNQAGEIVYAARVLYPANYLYIRNDFGLRSR